MEKEQIFRRDAGFFTLFLSSICTISSGVVTSILQEICGLVYGMTGTLLSLTSIGNLLAGFVSGMLPAKISTKEAVVLLTVGYGAGHMIVGFLGWILVLMLGFFTAGAAKGSTANTCTILMADNSGDRTKDMNIMYSYYALGALLCSLFIVAAMKTRSTAPMLVLATCGLLLWPTSCVTPAEAKAMEKDWNIDRSFPKSRRFWMFTGPLFYQNVAGTSVTGWMVTYFKGNGVISGSLSSYTITVMWRAALIARLLIALVIPIRNSYSAMTRVGIGCIIFCMGLMMASTQTIAILLLFTFAFTTTSTNSTVVASTGRMTSTASMGIIPPVTSSGAITMPWIIGIASGYAGIGIGMASNTIPCVGMLPFSTAVKRLKEQELQTHAPR